MIIIRCDRCGTDDDLHTRTLEVDFTDSTDPMSVEHRYHLCGYCWSRIQLFITNRGTHVTEDNS